MRRLLILLLAAAGFASPVVAGLPTWPAGLTVYRLKQGANGYTGWSDTFINSSAGDSGKNFGGDDTLFVSPGAWTGTWHPGRSKILHKADLSQILPDNFVIALAREYWYEAQGGSGTATSDTAGVHRVFFPWAEGAGTGTASSSAATWTTATDSTQWTSPGCSSVNSNNYGWSWTSIDSTVGSAFSGADTADVNAAVNDMQAQPLALFRPKNSATEPGRRGWVTFDWTHQAQLWQLGANTNNGVVIQSHNSNNNKQWGLISSEHPDTTYRPYLMIYGFAVTQDTVTVTLGGDVPLGLGPN